MGMIKDKSLILNEIKLHYGFKNDAEFARFLGIKPNSLANWYSRNTFNYETLFTKCDDIRAEWFFTGEGSMLKAEKTSTSIDIKLTTEEPFENSDAEYWKNEYIAVLKECREIEKKYIALLENRLQEVFTADKSSKTG